jgi:very-long-chain enoyl-CoA reductase
MVILVWKGRKATVTLPQPPTTDALIREAERISGISRNRIRLYFEVNGHSIQLAPVDPIPPDPIVLTIVDSGPQVSPTIESLIEYIPPIFLWLLVLLIVRPEFNEYVQLTTLMWVLHFAKRVFEVLFIHTFSMATLPLFSIKDNSAFKNCGYYWAFAVAMALNMTIAAEKYSAIDHGRGEAGLVIWCTSEILNGYCHIALRKLRPKGSLGHFFPKGFLFNTIVAPNYTFEILAWVGFAMFSQTLVSIVFPIVGGVQMFIWAHEKRKRLAIQFPIVARRGRILPFL